tara:strand:- start:970 stop:1977 length:1008 start_codon:yes stop_codon:yes gene_type:complete
MLQWSMDTTRTIPSKGSSEKDSSSLQEKTNPIQTLGKSVPLDKQCESLPHSPSKRPGSKGVRKVKKVKKRKVVKKGTREKSKETSLKKSLGKGSLKEETLSNVGSETREKVDVPKLKKSSVKKSLTDSVWEEEGNCPTPPLENDNATQTLRLKSRTCNCIVKHRGKKRLCWRECFRNSNVCERHYPRQQCSFKELREGEWYYCERKTKTEYCFYHSKGKRDQCKGFTTDSDMKKQCTMKRVRGSDFCKKHANQPRCATICGAPKGKTVCKVVTSRGSYCREHSSLPGRTNNYGSDKRVEALDNALWGLFKQYKSSGNQKYLGVMVVHKDSKGKLA